MGLRLTSMSRFPLSLTSTRSPSPSPCSLRCPCGCPCGLCSRSRCLRCCPCGCPCLCCCPCGCPRLHRLQLWLCPRGCSRGLCLSRLKRTTRLTQHTPQDFIQRRNRTEHAVQQVTETRIS